MAGKHRRFRSLFFDDTKPYTNMLGQPSRLWQQHPAARRRSFDAARIRQKSGARAARYLVSAAAASLRPPRFLV